MSTPRSVRLVRRAKAGAGTLPRLDDGQCSVVAHSSGPLLVVGSAGTGKTVTLVETFAHRVSRGVDASRLLVLAHGPDAARRLRDRLAARVGGTTRGPLARTFHSYALDLLRRDAAERGAALPSLQPAGESDVVVRELLVGDLGGGGVEWPQQLLEAVPLRGFAQELRDLLMRCHERGVEPARIADLGRRHRRDDWVAVAGFADQYQRIVGLRSGGSAYDQAELVTAAADLLDGDPARLAAERTRLDAVMVDDFQEVDPAQLRLLELLAGDGRTLIAFSDPDQALYAFRGSDPRIVEDFASRFRTLHGDPAPTVFLRTGHRQAAAPAAVTRALARRLPFTASHPGAVPSPAREGGTAELVVCHGPSEQGSAVAAHLQRLHTLEKVPWSGMAVLVRGSRSMQAQLRRQLVAHGVPVGGVPDDTPVGLRPAVAALLLAARAGSAPEQLDDATAAALLTGPIGRGDRLWLRSVTRVLANDGTRSAARLAELARNGSDAEQLPSRLRPPFRRVARVLAAAAAASGETPEVLLWAVWDASGLGREWERHAWESDLFDGWLDDVTEALDRATRFVSEHPGASVDLLVGKLREERVWRPGSRRDWAETVEVATVHRAQGREWEAVVVVGLQEGAWPDLRPRGSLLGAEELMSLVADLDPGPLPITHRVADERRVLLAALGRARSHVLVCAVDDPDAGEVPSRFLEELGPVMRSQGSAPAPDHSPPGRPPSGRPARLSATLVAELRRAVCDPSERPDRRQAAALHLARLSDAGHPSADPEGWFGLLRLSDPGPLREEHRVADGEATVVVSPSRLASFMDCQLRWLLESAGGGGPAATARQVGTAVHAVAESAARAAAPTEESMLAQLDARWDEVSASQGWAGRRERAQAEEMVRTLARWLSGRTLPVAGVEVPFDVTVGPARVVGTVDRVERDASGRAVVVDFKTGSSIPSAADAAEDPQLAAYQLAAEAGAFEHLGVRGAGGAGLVHLRTSGARATERHQPPLDEDPSAAEAAAARVVSAASGMAGSVFMAMANDGCRWCAVRTACPLQQHNGGLL